MLPVLFAPDLAAAKRFVEFFKANIRNPHTRKAYARTASEFAAWGEETKSMSCGIWSPFMWRPVWKTLQKRLAAPSVKRHLAAIRMLFDWLVVGRVIAVNPAKGSEHSEWNIETFSMRGARVTFL